MALASVLFLVTEALLGAGLVLFNYVDKDQSVGRAFYLSLHLVNTLLLLGALVLTAWFSREGAQQHSRAAVDIGDSRAADRGAGERHWGNCSAGRHVVSRNIARARLSSGFFGRG